MVRDEQTHTVPSRIGRSFRAIARLMGYSRMQRRSRRSCGTLDTVTRRYSELFPMPPDLSATTGNLVFTGGRRRSRYAEDASGARLRTSEARDEDGACLAFRALRGHAFHRGAKALTEITPALLEAFSRAGNPDAALRAFDILLKALPAGAQLFALLPKPPAARPARNGPRGGAAPC